MIRIAGYCPMGCGQSLMAEEGRAENRVVCWSGSCPEPLALQRILDESETEHVVQFSGGGFTIRHPLRERLDDRLLDCELHLFCMDLSGPPGGRGGTFRSLFTDGEWVFERIEDKRLAPDTDNEEEQRA